MSEYRLSQGGRIDRNRPLHFRFNGRNYQGYQGDTLASALLANGVHLIGRSAKYHRPRGIISIGSDATNALVQLIGEPNQANVLATRLELYEGLEARSINCWPSVGWDLAAINDVLSSLLPADFYHRTFSANPNSSYNRFIRRITHSGQVRLGQAANLHNSDKHYEKRDHECDVLIIGAGPAGLAAALVAARSGVRVLLVDEQSEPGGDLLNHPDVDEIDGKSALSWVAEVIDELESIPDAVYLAQTTVVAYYDDNLLIAVEHKPAHQQHLLQIKAKQVIIASGAVERPLVFPNNDRPGVMLAASVRGYLNRHALRCGFDAILFTNNNSAYATAFDLARKHTTVLAIVDVRATIDQRLLTIAEELEIPVLSAHTILSVSGTTAANMVEVAPLDDPGNSRRIVCDLVCHCGGWDPSVQLHVQSGAKPIYDSFQACFIPGESVQAERTVGAARGLFGLHDCLKDGLAAGTDAAQAAGFAAVAIHLPAVVENNDWPLAISPVWELNARPHSGKAFVDFQNDVTSADIKLALSEDCTSLEQVHRHATAGIAADPGKLSNTNMIGLIAQYFGVEPSELDR